MKTKNLHTKILINKSRQDLNVSRKLGQALVFERLESQKEEADGKKGDRGRDENRKKGVVEKERWKDRARKEKKG